MSARDVPVRAAQIALWKARKANVERITSEVAAEFGLDAATLFETRTRIPPAPEARREVMTRLWEQGYSLSEIGRLIGRHASTVHAAMQRSFGDEYVALSPGPGRVRMPQLSTKEEAAE